MNEIPLKTLYYVRTKTKLYELYESQYSRQAIRNYINDIIKDYRPNVNHKCRNVSTQEFLTFVELYGLPDGYRLSDTLQNELNNRKLKI